MGDQYFVSNLKITPAQTAEMLIVVHGPQRSPSGGVAGGGSGVPNDPRSYRGEGCLQWPNYDNGYTHTHTHTHTLSSTHAHTHTHTHHSPTHAHTHTHTHTHAHTHTCMYAGMYACTHTRTHTHMHVRRHVCMHTHTTY